MVQLTRFGSTENSETPQPKSNMLRAKKKLHKQIQKEGNFTTTRAEWVSKKPEKLSKNTVTVIKFKFLHLQRQRDYCYKDTITFIT